MNILQIKSEGIDHDDEDDDDEGQHFEIIEKENTYSCESCNMQFDSLDNHIQLYHPDQEIVVQLDNDNEIDNDLLKEDFIKEENLVKEEMIGQVEDEELYETEYLDYEFMDEEVAAHELMEVTSPNTQNRGKVETIHEEDCLDKDGRVYSRKVCDLTNEF